MFRSGVRDPELRVLPGILRERAAHGVLPHAGGAQRGDRPRALQLHPPFGVAVRPRREQQHARGDPGHGERAQARREAGRDRPGLLLCGRQGGRVGADPARNGRRARPGDGERPHQPPGPVRQGVPEGEDQRAVPHRRLGKVRAPSGYRQAAGLGRKGGQGGRIRRGRLRPGDRGGVRGGRGRLPARLPVVERAYPRELPAGEGGSDHDRAAGDDRQDRERAGGGGAHREHDRDGRAGPCPSGPRPSSSSGGSRTTRTGSSTASP